MKKELEKDPQRPKTGITYKSLNKNPLYKLDEQNDANSEVNMVERFHLCIFYMRRVVRDPFAKSWFASLL